MHNFDRTLNEFNDETNDEFAFEMEADEFSDEYEAETLLEDEEEMALASELLSVSSEAELDYFLGKLLRKAGRAAGKFVKSSTGQALGGILKAAAKTALPIVGNAIAPGIGGVIAGAAGDAFGLEAEGLSGEDAEWEAAKRFIKFADSAAKQVAKLPPSVPPVEAAKRAAVIAARQFAPGLLKESAAPSLASPVAAGSGSASGRWIRRGNKIILLGV
jgi:hypothetical protein